MKHGMLGMALAALLIAYTLLPFTNANAQSVSAPPGDGATAPTAGSDHPVFSTSIDLTMFGRFVIFSQEDPYWSDMLIGPKLANDMAGCGCDIAANVSIMQYLARSGYPFRNPDTERSLPFFDTVLVDTYGSPYLSRTFNPIYLITITDRYANNAGWKVPNEQSPRGCHSNPKLWVLENLGAPIIRL